VRIAYDVTPLSHPRTGVGNYILGALQGMLAAAEGEHEFVVFGPMSIRGRRLLDDALEDLQVDKRLLTVPLAHATRRAWGALGRPSAERFLGGFDVLHFSDWMVPPQRSGLRATMIHDLGPLRYPERLHPRTVRMHTGTAREAAKCDLVFTNSEFTANDVVERLGIPRRRVCVAYPGVDPAYHPEGERRELGYPYVFTTATEDWRKNRATVDAALELLGDDLSLAALGDEGRFIGGHPLAGAETSGVEHARADLFEGARWYLTPGERTEGVLYDRVQRTIADLGAVQSGQIIDIVRDFERALDSVGW